MGENTPLIHVWERPDDVWYGRGGSTLKHREALKNKTLLETAGFSGKMIKPGAKSATKKTI
jgi:hypothetical protein